MESTWVWGLRSLCELLATRPTSLVAIAACGAMYALYSDMQEETQRNAERQQRFLEMQTEAMTRITEQLTEMNVRLQTIEKGKHEH